MWANAALQETVKGSATIYEKAMDQRYLETHIGGAYHRLFDQGHTVIGALKAGLGASETDTLWQEMQGTVQGLARDVSTVNGLPVANWNHETFQQVAAQLEKAGISKRWFYDINTVDAPALLGGVVSGVAVLLLLLKREDTPVDIMAGTSGALTLAAVASANPVLGLVSLFVLALAWHKAHGTAQYAKFLEGNARGAAVSATTLMTSGAALTLGAPALVAVAAAIGAGIAVQKIWPQADLVDISRNQLKQSVQAVKDKTQDVPFGAPDSGSKALARQKARRLVENALGT